MDISVIVPFSKIQAHTDYSSFETKIEASFGSCNGGAMFAGFSDAEKAEKMEIVRKGLGAGARTCEEFSDEELGSCC